VDLGPIGIWSAALRYGDRGEGRDAASELESLGFGTLWLPGGIGGDIFEAVAALLEATSRVALATGIVNLWMHQPAEVAEAHARITSAHPDRFLLGVGVSHAPLVDADHPGRYARPLEATDRYLDELDTASPPVPAAERALAALGPRMLALARDRSSGAHPYLVTPEHTRQARAVLGDGPLLAPEQSAVLESDPARARELARRHLSIYLQLPNYVRNLRRLGFTDEDVAAPGSDRLVDGVVAWGDVATIVRRVKEHRDAGADHVCVQVLAADPRVLPRDAWRELGPALAS
jgi:probable F420-dependent oxidoreductase